MKALIVIDIQNGLTKSKPLHNEQFFIKTVNKAIKTYRDSNCPIVFVQHINKLLQKDSRNWEIDQRINKQTGDLIIQKNHGNAFQNTQLKAKLTELGIKSITFCGLSSHGCVKASCLGGISEGFETAILKHGHFNWNKDAEKRIFLTEKELIEKGVEITEIENES
jgi:nicotinamidase-related amidase